MSKKATNKHGLRYRGQKWIQPQLPVQHQSWLEGKGNSIRKDLYHRGTVKDELHALIERDHWQWPKRPIYFLSDMHADTDAFVASLVATGGVKKNGPSDGDFKLTRVGRKARFIIGGDCFDKGPSSIQLLRAVRMLMKKKADVRILAGNHDVRMMLGIRSLGLPPDPRTDHFFIRMGPKVVPFLKEIHDQYLQGKKRALRDLPTTRECRRRLYPPKSWFNEFPRLASWVMPDSGIEREMKRLRAKMDRFEDDVARAGLNLRTAYAAARKWQQLFLHPKGEFYWFYDEMRLAHREGSFLFIHAGLDDRIARTINERGIKTLNREFRRQVQKDLFDFYYGPLANSIRTKYREVDMPLTRQGVEAVRQKGIYAVVHGHLNLPRGQRIMLRKGMVNFQCDSTMDRNTRKKEGLKGPAAAATIFLPQGVAMGVSGDYPFIKTFDPQLS
jgi:hypothetical protein